MKQRIPFLKILLFYPSFVVRHISYSKEIQTSSNILTLFENEKLLIAWKSGNIAVQENDRVRRAAGPDIVTWCKSILKQEYKDFLIETKLETPFPGIFFVLKSKSFLKIPNSNTSSSCSLDSITYRYVAVVSGSVTNHSLQHPLLSSLSSIQTMNSASYGQLSLIEFSTSGTVGSSTLCSALSDLGYPVIGTMPNKRMPPLLALVCLTISKDHALAWKAEDGTVHVETPKKFLKFMTREKLQHDRLVELQPHTQTQNADNSSICSRVSGDYKYITDDENLDGNHENDGEEEVTTNSHYATANAGPALSVQFMGLTLQIPSNGLAPRASSGALVEEALEHLRGKDDGRVLDLGCGGGALLLAVLHSLPRTRGTGVDLDENALVFARRNAHAILQSEGQGLLGTSDRATFLQGDFGKLSEVLPSRGRGPFYGGNAGLSSVAVAGGGGGGGVVEASSEEYDVILCNPPFLSISAARSRVTRESRLALVAGPTGWEAYGAVCRSLRECEDRGGRLLGRGGLLVFQLPGGATGESAVSAVVRAHGFRVLGTRLDGRGVKRCLSCTR